MRSKDGLCTLGICHGAHFDVKGDGTMATAHMEVKKMMGNMGNMVKSMALKIKIFVFGSLSSWACT